MKLTLDHHEAVTVMFSKGLSTLGLASQGNTGSSCLDSHIGESRWGYMMGKAVMRSFYRASDALNMGKQVAFFR